MLQVAIIGGGWAGLSAAVHATLTGQRVQVFEMAHRAGGRARSLDDGAGMLDNGQHILIGAYCATLALMQQVGVSPSQHLHRSPLTLCYPDGSGLVLPKGPAALAFARGVMASQQWPLAVRLALLVTAARWRLAGFRCAPGLSVAELCRKLPAVVVADLIEPLCVAGLNTPMPQASGAVFLRILRDALFGGPGSADLLLPRAPLSALLPDPGVAWLRQQGALWRGGHRVMRLERVGAVWQVDGEPFDAVVLATPAREAARLVQAIAPAWSAMALDLRYEPIVTVWLRDAHWRGAQPMTALRSGATAPAQFCFDLGQLGGEPGLHAFVVSGAGEWLAKGLEATEAAVRQQAQAAFPGHFSGAEVLVAQRAERRATFACTPGLQRPPQRIAPRLVAAGDHVDGPYPATLEGAVRSGQSAAQALAAG